jgi:beta-lactamase regulating signal transducer with metallopeptidase domain
MSDLFIRILNMSISASFVALIVMIIRLFLKKAPKIYSYILWTVVFFRLICPFTIPMPVSVIPVQPQTIPHDLVSSGNPAIQSGVPIVDRAINKAIKNSMPGSSPTESISPIESISPAESISPTESIHPLKAVLEAAALLWLSGVAALILYGIISYIRLKRRVMTGIRIQDNIYETEFIKTPIVLGFLHTKIYVPIGLGTHEMEYVTAHEKTHIRRLDYLIKPLAFLITAIHWFNPLAWFSYLLMVKDMELSADESVMKHYDIDIRGGYAGSLLALAVKRSGLPGPLAFGETGVKGRVKNILNYKKPGFWVSITAIVIVLVVSLSLIVSQEAVETPENITNNTLYYSSKDNPKDTLDNTSKYTSNQVVASTPAPNKSSETVYTTEYNNVKITLLSENQGFQPKEFEASDSQVVAFIDSALKTSMTSKQNVDLENNHTNQYTIKLSGEIGGYSCKLYYDTLYDKAYLVKDGGLVAIGTDFARYINSFFENTTITFKIDETDAALFKKYGWTLDYQVSERKNKLGNISTLSEFNPNAYYFAYNNELSKDIGLDMSSYAGSTELTVRIYRIHESMPQEFYPIMDCRGIVVKKDGKIIGAFISAGRHSAFNACSLKGNSFEKVVGKPLLEWLRDKIKADSLEERLAKSEPEQVIEEYFTALDKKDTKRAKYCISKKNLMENLTVNMPNEELFNEGIDLPLTEAYTRAKSNFDNLTSSELLKTELIRETGKNARTYRVYVKLQYKEEVTIGSGEQFFDCSMIYESPQTGWKIEGFGQG